jgi:hypothetical protein
VCLANLPFPAITAPARLASSSSLDDCKEASDLFPFLDLLLGNLSWLSGGVELASAFRLPLAAASPKPSLVAGEDRDWCLADSDLESTIWALFCSASLRFLSVFSASVSPRGRGAPLPLLIPPDLN